MFTRCLRLAIVLCLLGALRVSAAVLYVDVNSTNPISPFSSWATAATNIQDAVDASETGDEVLVTNGLYQYGGRPVSPYFLTNRLVVSNGITVQSVNGPALTIIQGYQALASPNGSSAVRCAYLTNGASLVGFTLANGGTMLDSGDVTNELSCGGVLCASTNEVLSNCVLIGNLTFFYGGGVLGGCLNNCMLASNSATVGGGAFGSLLVNCVLTSNSAVSGGGANQSTLNNCTLTGNSASIIGGGESGCTLNNCICYFNTAQQGANYSADLPVSFLNNCCTTPLPPAQYGTGNITNNPLFVNPAAGLYELQPGSPCVNAGNNASVTTTTDLAGNPRIAGGTVDMGAYELQLQYVSVAGTNPVSPFTNWATAATNIQDAVDIASNYDEVLVTNGVYQYGGRAFYGTLPANRLLVTKDITVQSVNGPALTIIQGYQSSNYGMIRRCVYLANGPSLIGFTLTQCHPVNLRGAC